MPERIPVTLQMYTVRDDAARDFSETIKKVAEIGFVGVELAGYGSAKTAEAAKQILDDNGLFVAGAHVGLDLLENDIERVIREATIMGHEFVVCPYLPDDRRRSADDYRRLALSLNDIGARLKESGLQLCYHNHAFEFDKFGGDTYAYDVMLGSTDRELVQIEMDAYWVQKAGESPAAYLRKYAGRVPLIHLKDMTAGENGTFAEVGEGIVDFKAIFAAAETAGTLFYVVEQDRCEKHAPLESIEISFRNLQKWGIA